jgi:hypothetical protein
MYVKMNTVTAFNLIFKLTRENTSVSANLYMGASYDVSLYKYTPDLCSVWLLVLNYTVDTFSYDFVVRSSKYNCRIA